MFLKQNSYEEIAPFFLEINDVIKNKKCAAFKNENVVKLFRSQTLVKFVLLYGPHQAMEAFTLCIIIMF